MKKLVLGALVLLNLAFTGTHSNNKHKVDFEFRQLGSYFIKDNVRYSIPRNQLSSQARKANINVSFKD